MDSPVNKKTPANQGQDHSYGNNSATTHATLQQLVTK
jgi:hypothetical protein